MVNSITIDEQTQSLIDELYHAEGKSRVLRYHVSSRTGKCRVKRDAVIEWLSEENNDRPSRFLREALRATLLRDLHYSLLAADERHNRRIKKEASWFNKFQYMSLVIAGTLFAICDGFDGVSSILFLFTAVPSWLVFVLGFAFSLLSVAVFYGFDLVTISNNLGVEFSHARQLLDVLVEQAEQIKQLRKQINRKYKVTTDPDELRSLQAILAMLIIRYDALDEARVVYTTELNKSYLNALKLTLAVIAGILFFSYGFFSGQSMALAFVGLLSISTAAAFWPVTIVGIVIGFAAFSVYWFVERPGLENLVGRWLGLDKDKIAILADDAIVSKQKNKLLQLEVEIENLQNKPARRKSLSDDQMDSTRNPVTSTRDAHSSLPYADRYTRQRVNSERLDAYPDRLFSYGAVYSPSTTRDSVDNHLDAKM